MTPKRLEIKLRVLLEQMSTKHTLHHVTIAYLTAIAILDGARCVNGIDAYTYHEWTTKFNSALSELTQH